MIEISGNLSKPNAINDLIESIFSRIKSRLPEIATKYKNEFVKNALTTRGPNSLGQVTGNLARSFTVEPRPNAAEAGGLEGFVPPGQTFDYALAQDIRKNWFQFGVDSSLESLLTELRSVLDLAVTESNR